MRRGQPLSGDELALLRRNPLAAALLERLVLIDEAGAIGLFRAEDWLAGGPLTASGCASAGGRRRAPLYAGADRAAGRLAGRDRSAADRAALQAGLPRAVLLTPAELEAGYASGRLAGRRLKSRQAIAVLANLGWLIEGYGTVPKPFYDLGYAAHFETGGYGYYGDDDDGATTGTLAFWPLSGRY